VPSVLHYYHEGAVGNHAGRDKMIKKMGQSLWWPGMNGDVDRYVAHCQKCKPQVLPQEQNELKPLWSNGPNELVGVDLFGPLPISKNGNSYVGVMVDNFSKYVMAVPMKSTSAKDAVDLVMKWILLFGPPSKLLSDQGKNFTSGVLREVCSRLGVVKIFTTPHHQQTNGQAERMVGTLSRVLRAKLKKVTEWEEELQYVVYAYNTSYNASIGHIPYFLWHGRVPSPINDVEVPLERKEGAHSHKMVDARAYAKSLQQKMVEAVVIVREAQERAKAEMKRLGKVLEVPRVYAEGDLVWLFDPNPPGRAGEDLDDEGINQNRFKRFWNFWKGPYFVKGMEGSNVVLQAFERDKAYTVHQNRVKRYIYPLRGLGAVGDARNGYLQDVLDHRKEDDGSREYKVLWQLQRGQKIEWVDESLVPLNLILEYLDRLGIVPVDDTNWREELKRWTKMKDGERTDHQGKKDLGHGKGTDVSDHQDDEEGDGHTDLKVKGGGVQVRKGGGEVTERVGGKSGRQLRSRVAPQGATSTRNTPSRSGSTKQGVDSSARPPPRRSPRLG
jgi:hypothetical protein